METYDRDHTPASRNAITSCYANAAAPAVETPETHLAELGSWRSDVKGDT